MSAPAIESLRTLGEYVLLEKLGQGGMGTVFKARHTRLDRLVAVKVLAPALVADPQALARFHREMKVVGQLDHANIVRALDARQIDQTHLLVMEYVAGVDLAELLRRVGPLAVADACAIARQAAIGLQYAHQHGLVHRDIKPSNLMLTRRGEVKILDLGLARVRTPSLSGGAVTTAGLAMGTPDFMAPEQAADSRTVDIRADIYSLGCTLYALLCGRAPFDSPDQPSVALKMAAHLRDPVPPIRRVRSEVPERLAAVLDRMLAKAPSDRFAEPREIVDAVAPFSRDSDLPGLARRGLDGSGQAVANQPATTEYFAGSTASIRGRTTSATPRRKTMAWAASGVALAIIIVLGMLARARRAEKLHEASIRGRASHFDADRGQPENHAQATDRKANSIEQSAPTSSRTTNAGHRAGRSAVTAPAATIGPRPARRIVLSWPLPGQSVPVLWLMSLDGTKHTLLDKEDGTSETQPCFSPDGRRIAFIRADLLARHSSVWVCRSDGSDARQLVPARNARERLFSPVWISNTQLYCVRGPNSTNSPDMEVCRIDLDEGVPRRVFGFRQVLGTGAGLITDVSPDRTHLLIVAQEAGDPLASDVFITDLTGGDVRTVWRGPGRDGRAIWAPSGRQIAWHHTVRRNRTVRRNKPTFSGVAIARLARDGRWIETLPPRKQTPVTPLAWSPDGGVLLCARVVPSRDQNLETVLFLIDDQFHPVRVIGKLAGGRGLPVGRRAGRVADWAKLPPELARQRRSEPPPQGVP